MSGRTGSAGGGSSAPKRARLCASGGARRGVAHGAPLRRVRTAGRWSTHPTLAVAARVEHLEVGRAHVEADAVLPFAIGVLARCEASLDVHEAALGDHLLRALGERRPAADAVPVGLFDALAAVRLSTDTVDGDAELTDGAAVRGHLELGIPADVADEDDLAD